MYGTCPVSTCDSTHRWNCTTESSCTAAGVGGYWCGSYCNSSPCSQGSTCGSSALWYCSSQTSCQQYGGVWCAYQSGGGGYCNSAGYTCPDYSCSSTNPSSCTAESQCTAQNNRWCPSPPSGGSGYCTYQSSTCPDYTCGTSNPYNCTSQSQCTAQGNKWCQSAAGSYSAGYCTYSSSTCPDYTCSSSNFGSCYSQSECTAPSVGGQWCGSYCAYSCPVCESSNNNYYGCYDSTSCQTAGGKWCQNPPSSGSGPGYSGGSSGWCTNLTSTCPDYSCGPNNLGYCNSQATCSGAGGNYCPSGSGSYYCSNGSCPQCTENQRSNCWNQTDCATAGGNWCASGSNYGYCSNAECPQCSSFNLGSCSTQSACTQAGGSFCPSGSGGLSCWNGSCPVCGQSNLGNCFTQADCEANLGSWSSYSSGSGGYCSYSGRTAPHPTCGNNVCESGEETACSSDCRPSYVCGNNACETEVGETRTLCPTDCTGSSYCPNGICEYSQGETQYSCPADCQPRTTQCGNGYCDYFFGETQYTCATDCGVSEFCGNSVCAGSENRENCPSDCRESVCGDFFCGVSETPLSCPNDCGLVVEKKNRPVCPAPEQIKEIITKCEQIGYKPQFFQSGNGCGYADCRPPEALEFSDASTSCREETDAQTGGVRYTCETACPAERPNLESDCTSFGGRVERFKSGSDCTLSYCIFGGQKTEKKSSFFEKDYCPSPEDVEAFSAQCELQGFSSVAEIGSNGCTYVHCRGKDEFKTQCPIITFEGLEAEKESCAAQSGFVSRTFSSAGCVELTCVTSANEQAVCGEEVPKEAFESCAADGGGLVVKKNATGCIVFAECVKEGTSEFDFREVEVTKRLDPTEVLGLVLQLEELKIKISDISGTLSTLESYWRAKNPAQAERFSKAQLMLESVVKEIDDIRGTLNQNKQSISRDLLKEIKIRLLKIREGALQDVVFVLLSSTEDSQGEERTQSKDCESDFECFNRKFRVCDPAVYLHNEGEEQYATEIIGIEDDQCVLSISFSGKSMTCQWPDFSVESIEPEKFQEYCEGELVRELQNKFEAAALPVGTEDLPTGCKSSGIDPATGVELVACPKISSERLNTDAIPPIGNFILGFNWLWR